MLLAESTRLLSLGTPHMGPRYIPRRTGLHGVNSLSIFKRCLRFPPMHKPSGSFTSSVHFAFHRNPQILIYFLNIRDNAESSGAVSRVRESSHIFSHAKPCNQPTIVKRAPKRTTIRGQSAP